MRKRYLHDAFRAVDLNPHRFYSVEEIAGELEATGVLPSDLNRARLVSNLRSYALRHISAAYRRRSGGVYHYLGAAWYYPVPRRKPETLGELEEEARQAVRQKTKIDQPVPSVNPIDSSSNRQLAPKPRLAIWTVRSAMAVAALIVGFLVTGWGSTFFLEYSRRGPRAALQSQLSNPTPSQQEKYSLAEAHYGMGNFEAAQKAIQDLLMSRTLEPGLESDSFLLLAQIQRNRGFMNNALNYAMAAKRACSKHSEHWSARMRNVDTFLAVSLLRLKRYDEAAEHLSALFDREAYPSYRGYIALMLADTHFWLQQPEQALEWNSRALVEYRSADDRTGIANTLMNEAWLTIILGHPDAAEPILLKAEKMCLDLEYELMQPYLHLTRQLLDKCRTGKFNLHSLASSNDQELKLYIDFVEDYVCGAPRIVTNDPPAPPPGTGEPPPRYPAPREQEQ